MHEAGTLNPSYGTSTLAIIHIDQVLGRACQTICEGWSLKHHVTGRYLIGCPIFRDAKSAIPRIVPKCARPFTSGAIK